jgi:hypothetical protein
MELDDLFDLNRGRDKRGSRDQDDRYERADGRNRDRDDEHGRVEGKYRTVADDHEDNRGQSEGRERWRGDRERGHGDGDDMFDLENLAQRVLASRKLMIVAGVVVVGVVALAVVFWQPLFSLAVTLFEQSGLKSAVEGVRQGTGGGK